MAQGLNIGIFHRVALSPRARLGEKSFAGGRILEVGREFGEIGFPPLAAILLLSVSRYATALGMASMKNFSSKFTFVSVEKSASQVNTFAFYHLYQPCAFDRDQGKPLESKNQQSCRSATSGCFPHTPILVPPSPFAVCRIGNKHSFLLV